MNVDFDCMEWADREKWEGGGVEGDVAVWVGEGVELGGLDELMPMEANLVLLRETAYHFVDTFDRYRDL